MHVSDPRFSRGGEGMFRFAHAAIFAMAMGLVLQSAAADDKAAAPDHAAADEKPAQTVKGFGAVVDGDCQITEQVRVTITVPKTTHDLTYARESAYTKMNAPRIVQDIKGDFSLAVKVEAFPFPKPNTSSNNRYCFVSSGLLIWQDERNFIRLERAALGGQNQPYVWLECFVDGKSETTKRREIDDKDTYLRITRIGDKFTFATSEDGLDWTEIENEEVKLAEQLKGGVMAINTTTDDFSTTLEIPKPSPNPK
jgi:regulation of enolase protein 1 (concanavalin A-like superfamily)